MVTYNIRRLTPLLHILHSFPMRCYHLLTRALQAKLVYRFKAMLHEAIFLATCNVTMTNKKPFKLQRGCYTQATCLATLRKVEGRSTFLATRNATIAVAKWGVTREFFLATCNATFVALQVARKIASCNMAFMYDMLQGICTLFCLFLHRSHFQCTIETLVLRPSKFHKKNNTRR